VQWREVQSNEDDDEEQVYIKRAPCRAAAGIIANEAMAITVFTRKKEEGDHSRLRGSRKRKHVRKGFFTNNPQSIPLHPFFSNLKIKPIYFSFPIVELGLMS
jgi:hypothetical protein